MIPKIIHYCWLSNNVIPENLQRCMDSWKEKLQDYEFVLWNFERFDINTSIWVKQAFEAKQYAFAADFIRLYAVYHYGGIYLDMDIEIVKPFDNLLNSDIMVGCEDDNTNDVEAGCFGAEKGHPFIGRCLNYYKEREFIMSDGCYDTLPLPQIMKNIYHEDRTNNITFYPSDYFTAKSYKTGLIKVTPNTHSIHHFAGSWVSPSEAQKHHRVRRVYSIFGDNVISKFIIQCNEKMAMFKRMFVRFFYRLFVELGPVGTFKHYFKRIIRKKAG